MKIMLEILTKNCTTTAPQGGQKVKHSRGVAKKIAKLYTRHQALRKLKGLTKKRETSEVGVGHTHENNDLQTNDQVVGELMSSMPTRNALQCGMT